MAAKPKKPKPKPRPSYPRRLLGLALVLFVLPSCGMLQRLDQAVSTAPELRQRQDQLDESQSKLAGLLNTASRILGAFQGTTEKVGKELQSGLTDLEKLHAQAVKQADHDGDGKVSGTAEEIAFWTAIAGGGLALYNERRKTTKEMIQKDGRIEHERAKRKQIDARLSQLERDREIERAKNGA